MEFNIDHIEVRTGINIPKVTFADCNMNTAHTKRKAIYVIDETRVNIDEWLVANKFQKKDSSYVNQGRKKDHNWIAEFDPVESKLIVDLHYED